MSAPVDHDGNWSAGGLIIRMRSGGRFFVERLTWRADGSVRVLGRFDVGNGDAVWRSWTRDELLGFTWTAVPEGGAF